MGRYGCGLFIARIDCPLANIRKIYETAMVFQEKSDKLKFRMLRRYRKIEVDSRFSAAEDRGRNLNFRHFRHFCGTKTQARRKYSVFSVNSVVKESCSMSFHFSGFMSLTQRKILYFFVLFRFLSIFANENNK